MESNIENSVVESHTVLDNKEDFKYKHPLYNKWTLWYTKPQVNKNETWYDLLNPIITFSSVEEFWGIYNSIPSADQLPVRSDYHLFKEGVRPEWDDVNNSKGGKWHHSFSNKHETNTSINELWLWTMLAVIGETIEDDENEVNGIVLSIRNLVFRICVWTKDCDEKKLKISGERFKKVLQLREDQSVEFISHDNFHIKGSKPLIVL